MNHHLELTKQSHPAAIEQRAQGSPPLSRHWRSRLNRGFVAATRSFRLLGIWAWGFLTLGFFYLPLSVHAGWPLHAELSGVTRGLFVGLTPGDVALCATAIFAAALSWFFVMSLVVDGAEWVLVEQLGLAPARPNPRRAEYSAEALDSRSGRAWYRGHPVYPRPRARELPAFAQDLFTAPLSPLAMLLALGLALPGMLTVIVHADDNPLAALGCSVLLGVSLWLVTSVTQALAWTGRYPAEAGHRASLSWWLHRRVFAQLRLGRWRLDLSLRRARDWLGRRSLLRAARIELELGRGERRNTLHISHFIACGYVGVVSALVLAIIVFYHPIEDGRAIPAGAVLFALVALITWLFGALRFHLARLYVAPGLVVLVWGLLAYKVGSVDHFYAVEQRTAAALQSRAGPLEILGGRRGNSRNLVVVTTTGGGIQAAAWTTWVLSQLIQERPALADELRVISGVSGGAVGSAFFISELRHCKGDERAACVRKRARRAYENATRSSLEAVGFGLVFGDVPRFFLGGLLDSTLPDRGVLLERRWAQTSSGANAESDPVPTDLASLVGDIRAGWIPLPILNTTAMETGRRIMVTPLDFTRGTGHFEQQGVARAETLDEYLFDKPGAARLSLWTGARLAATFPYVSPAARAEGNDDGCAEPGASGCRRYHHMIDGGYYDNYGVASALDWLGVALQDAEAKLQNCEPVGFQRVLVLQIRSSPFTPPNARPPSSGSISELAGPLLGILNIQDGAARERNHIELSAFLSSWRNRLRDGGCPHEGIQLETLVLEPQQHGDENPPLNWRLTPEDIQDIEARYWPARVAGCGSENPRGAVNAYLMNGEVCGNTER